MKAKQRQTRTTYSKDCHSQPQLRLWGFAVFCALLLPVVGHTATVVNLSSSAGGPSGRWYNIQMVQSTTNAPVAATASTNQNGSVFWAWTDSEATSFGRAEVGRLQLFGVGTTSVQMTSAGNVAAIDAQALSHTSWSDTLTINAGPQLFGQLGELTAKISISGNLLLASDPFGANVYFRVFVRIYDSYGADSRFTGGTMIRHANDGTLQTVPMDGALVGPGMYQTNFQFHFGRPIYITAWAEVLADARAASYSVAEGVRYGSALSDFGHTVGWAGIHDIHLPGGAPVTNFTIISDSGYDYVPGTTTNGPAATLCCGAVGGVKYVQYPDLVNGIDVDATFSPTDPISSLGWVLADDFPCTNNGPVTDIALWGSWVQGAVDPDATYTLGIWSDAPTNAAQMFRHPGMLLWNQTYTNGQYNVCNYTNLLEGFYNPLRNSMGVSTNLFQICFEADPTNTFTQTGTPAAPTNYWLSVAIQSATPPFRYFGWKTTSGVHNSSGVSSHSGALYPAPGDWHELRGFLGEDLNLAFAVTTSNSCPLPVIKCSDRLIECGTAWTLDPPPALDQCCPNPGLVTVAGAPVTNGTGCSQVITAVWQYTNCLQQVTTCIQTIFVQGRLNLRHPPAADTLTLEWTDGIHQESPTINGSFTDVPQAMPPTYTISPTNVTDFYRLRPNVPVQTIPAGSYIRGDALDGLSDAPAYSVYVSAFVMDQYLVTGFLWNLVKQYADANGYIFESPGTYKAPSHPVHFISWYDAVRWCNARSQMDGHAPVYYTDPGFTTLYKTGRLVPFIKPGANGWRLPTEAEWERAARGGLSGKRFPWGDTIANGPLANGGQANYNGETALTGGGGFHYDLGPNGWNSAFCNGAFPYTSPAGSFPANGYGLFDMAGNLFQMCWDWYDSSYYAPGQTDPQGPASGSYHVSRGGSWNVHGDQARCAYRYTGTTLPANYFGFRCVRGL